MEGNRKQPTSAHDRGSFDFAVRLVEGCLIESRDPEDRVLWGCVLEPICRFEREPGLANTPQSFENRPLTRVGKLVWKDSIEKLFEDDFAPNKARNSIG